MFNVAKELVIVVVICVISLGPIALGFVAGWFAGKNSGRKQALAEFTAIAQTTQPSPPAAE
jgi:hypothetical protein